jgi:hypothetical protein
VDEERRAAHEETPRRIVTGDDPRRLQVVIVVLVAVIVVLVVRPWGDGGPPVAVGPESTNTGVLTRPGTSPGVATHVSALPAVSPGAATSTPALRQVSCGSPDGWRATTVQRWPDRILPVRSWIAIDPVAAVGPADPAIPLAPVAAGVVTAIGYCAPLQARLQPPPGAVATLWMLTPTGPRRLSPVSLDLESLYRQGVLWRPAPELAAIPRDGGASAWPPGRYVVEIADPSHAFDRWLGIEILGLGQRVGPGSSAVPGPGADSGQRARGSSAMSYAARARMIDPTTEIQ